MRSPHHNFPRLRDSVAQTLILAYRENTSQLEQALQEEGFAPRVLRPKYTEKELSYSRTIRCLLNHDSAWTLASATDGLTLVMEADFVPCEGFGSLPLNFDPPLAATPRGRSFMPAVRGCLAYCPTAACRAMPRARSRT